MLGAITGDIIGSRFEANNHLSREFELFLGDESFFTDDTALTIAVARWLLGEDKLSNLLIETVERYPRLSYGGMFYLWAVRGGGEPYNSFGNGSAMRVSPVAVFAQDEHDCMELAKQSAAVTHNHLEGIKGAQATAWAAYKASHGVDCREIRNEIQNKFGYDMRKTVAEWVDGYQFDVTCQGTVPPALTCALEASDFEDAIRSAVSIGGDTDTICAICGTLAEPMFGVPDDIKNETLIRLDDHMRSVLARCSNKFN